MVTDTRILYRECRSLRAAGYRVVLIAQHRANTTVDGIEVRALGTTSSRMLRVIRLVPRALHLAKATPADLFHVHDPELLPVAVLLKWLGRTVVYDAHENVTAQIMNKRWLPARVRSAVARMFSVVQYWYTARLSAIVRAPGAPMFSWCRRVVTVANYPDLDEWPAVGGEKERCVCYVGSVTAERGLFEMITAIGRTDVTLDLAGSMPAAARHHATAMVGWHRVRAQGYLQRPAVHDLMSRSVAGLAVLHPTRAYLRAQPTKVFEYLAAGIPVVASGFPTWRRLFDRSGAVVWVDPFDTDAIATAIQSLADDPERAARMGARGRAFVEREYSSRTEERTLLQLYRALLSPRFCGDGGKAGMTGVDGDREHR